MEVTMWLLIVTVVTLNGTLYVSVPFANKTDCINAGKAHVVAAYHPVSDDGSGGEAYRVENTIYQCEPRSAMSKRD
jgi:hypothetical protein